MEDTPLGARLVATFDSDEIDLEESVVLFSSKLNKIFVFVNPSHTSSGRCYRLLHVFNCNDQNNYTSLVLPELRFNGIIKLITKAEVFVMTHNDRHVDVYITDTCGIVLSKIGIDHFKAIYAPYLAVSGDTAVIAGSYSDSIVIVKFTNNNGAYEMTTTKVSERITKLVYDRVIDNRYILCKIEPSNCVYLVDIYTGDVSAMPLAIGDIYIPCLAVGSDCIYFGSGNCLVELRKGENDKYAYKISRSFIGNTSSIDDILRYTGKTMTIATYGLPVNYDGDDDDSGYMIVEVDMNRSSGHYTYRNSGPSCLRPDCDSHDKYCAIMVNSWNRYRPKEFAVYVVDGV
jgi:adenosylcobinamide amidohydrolase